MASLNEPKDTGGWINARKLAESYVEPDWIVEGVLMRGAVTFLTGDSGSFKTFLAIDLAARLSNAATGDMWLKHTIDRSSMEFYDEMKVEGAIDYAQSHFVNPNEFNAWYHRLMFNNGGFRVAYVMAESAGSAHLRVRGWQQFHDQGLNPERFFVFPGRLAIEDELYNSIAEQEARMDGAFDVIIIDTFSANTPGVDENNKQSLSRSLDVLRNLKMLNKAVLVIHHGTKD
ncbi:MAG: AAA family ATPase, partial [Nitrospira sp.]|nr:AAA family ATPase [Nitrospira sp.]